MASDLDRKNALSSAGDTSRPVLRRRLLQERATFVTHAKTSPELASAEAALARHLIALLAQLEPVCLGLYWPMSAESNAPVVLLADEGLANTAMALPFARRTPVEMAYRAWDRLPPTVVDDCGIATSTGPPVVPDVVLAPCLGFTASGGRLGYGGGYFDRWLAAHPHVTAIGVAWSVGMIDDAAWRPTSHDVPMAVVVTEAGIVSAV